MKPISFYAPLKSPHHPTPSGDRTIARLLLAAWRQIGIKVELASQLRARIASPDPELQRQVAAQASQIAEQLIHRYRQRPTPERPRAWFTYHSYYKAVDWIGPRVSAALDIPYLLAEASHAPKRASGDWSFNHQGAEKAIKAATQIFCLNPNDKECLSAIIDPKRLVDLPPFLDLKSFAPVMPNRTSARHVIAERHRLDPRGYWLLAVGMMRPGDKLASYRELAEALRKLRRKDWRLLIVGDGTARPDVTAAFADLIEQVDFLGHQEPDVLPTYYAAANLLVWPAVNEAFGMSLLEAQACGLPVLAGAFGGVPSIVSDGKQGQAQTGWLAPPHQPDAFAGLLDVALDSDLATIGFAARQSIERHHDIASAAAVLEASLPIETML